MQSDQNGLFARAFAYKCPKPFGQDCTMIVLLLSWVIQVNLPVRVMVMCIIF